MEPVIGQATPPVKVIETLKTLLVPSWVNVPESWQFREFEPVKLMLWPLPAGVKVRSNPFVLIYPLVRPENAVTEPVKGEKAVRVKVPFEFLPVIEVAEFTVPCMETVSTVLPSGNRVPISAYKEVVPEKELAPVMVGSCHVSRTYAISGKPGTASPNSKACP